MRFDLSTDVGMGGDDGPMYSIVSSANVACELNDEAEPMKRAVRLALQHRIAVGALVRYSSPAGSSYEEMARDVAAQVEALERIVEKSGSRITHVRPHGLLYREVAADAAIAEIFVDAVWGVDPTLRLIGLAGSELPGIARAIGMDVAEEAFADLRYTAQGVPADPEDPRAVISDPEEAAAQALSIALGRAVDTIEDKAVALRADTICIRGGELNSFVIARAVHDTLAGAGLIIAPP